MGGDYEDYLRHKIEAGRASMQAGRGRSNDEVDAEFAARRNKASADPVGGEAQETLVLLEILALGEREVRQGLTQAALDVIDDLIAKTPDKGAIASA